MTVRWMLLLRELCLGPATWHSYSPLSRAATSRITSRNSDQPPLPCYTLYNILVLYTINRRSFTITEKVPSRAL